MRGAQRTDMGSSSKSSLDRWDAPPIAFTSAQLKIVRESRPGQREWIGSLWQRDFTIGIGRRLREHRDERAGELRIQCVHRCARGLSLHDGVGPNVGEPRSAREQIFAVTFQHLSLIHICHT